MGIPSRRAFYHDALSSMKNVSQNDNDIQYFIYIIIQKICYTAAVCYFFFLSFF